MSADRRHREPSDEEWQAYADALKAELAERPDRPRRRARRGGEG